jgi:hypothetical protein
MKDNVVDGAYYTYGIQAKYIQNVGREACRNETTGRPRLDGSIILKFS